MTIVIENGHGTDRKAIISVIRELNLSPHELSGFYLPSGSGWFNRAVDLFIISGELMIEIDGFPIYAHTGAHVHIPTNRIHTMTASNNLHFVLAIDTPVLDNLQWASSTDA